MAYLVKKINVANWPDGENTFFNSINNLSADAITNDIRTDSNELSLWQIEVLSDIAKVGISFVSSLDNKQNKIYLIALPFDEISGKFELKNTPKHGKTAIIGFNKHHYDLCNLTFEKLGDLAEVIASKTSDGSHKYVQSILVKDAINSIREMLTKGMIDRNKLGKYVKEQLEI